MLLTRDCKCVVSPNNCTGKPNLSKTLLSLIKGMALHVIWKTQAKRPTFTHYTKDGATRLDRIYTYITDSLQKLKQGAETISAAFSDNFAIISHMT